MIGSWNEFSKISRRTSPPRTRLGSVWQDCGAPTITRGFRDASTKFGPAFHSNAATTLKSPCFPDHRCRPLLVLKYWSFRAQDRAVMAKQEAERESKWG